MGQSDAGEEAVQRPLVKKEGKEAETERHDYAEASVICGSGH